MVGKTLSHYKILEKLGSGGMGEVYVAEDTKLHRNVALKILPPEMASDEERRHRFEREAQAIAALNHPNIVTVFSVEESEGVHFITMELVKGQTIRELMGSGHLSTKQLLPVATQIAEGLSKAHAAGIVHRDLKPENVMVNEDGLAKILDFGLAKLTLPSADLDSEMVTLTKATKAGVIMGTIQYMSPEQAAGHPFDYRSDQFSFGSILYEMATGKLAFKSPTMPQTLAAIIENKPEPIRKVNEEVPGELAAIVERCLAKDPNERYESTAELAAELKNVPETVPAWRPRRRVLWAAAGVLAAVLLLTIGPYLVRLLEQVLPGATGSSIESVVVLPLRNLSGDSEQDFFADAVTDALITDLAKIGALKVISRHSAMLYKGTDKPLPEIAQELNVDAVIEGSALRSGDRVRISAQLIDVETDQALWAETYDRDFQDLLILQSEVAQAVAREIHVAISPEEAALLESARSVDPEAYEHYLKGRMHWYKQTPQDVDRALQYFQLAEEKDPNFPLVHIGMGYVWTYYASVGLAPPGEMGAKMYEAFRKAREIDPTLAEAYESAGDYDFYFEWDWEGAEENYRRAIELKPHSADMRLFYQAFLVATKRPREAQEEIERCLELDPFNTYVQTVYGLFLLSERRFDDAINQFQKILKTEGDFGTAQLGLWAAYHHKGMHDLALASVKESYSKWGDDEMVEALDAGFAEDGYRGAMRMAAEKLVERSETYAVLATNVAIFFAYAGEKERTLDWLEKAYEVRETGLVKLQVDPDWDIVRDDPRFQDMLRRMNFPEA